MSGYSPSPDDPAGGVDRPEEPDGDRTVEPQESTQLGPPHAGTAAALLKVQDAARIIDGLIRGQKDDAIARSLGISTRTLDRRMVLVMDALGARTRFQLGLRLTPDLLAAVRSVADDTLGGDRPGLVDEPAPGPIRQAERLRRQLERRGRPVQAVVWLWLEADAQIPDVLTSSLAKPSED